ncbi:MAG TPA: Fic family protein [Chloroflexota bacterium]|nr:Fic family protein [Chloroflexota bacterium]
MKWDCIADLPENVTDLERTDLDVVREAWNRERGSLRDPGKFEQLESRLATEWAIETGLLEKLYTIDRGITETLLDAGLGAIERFHATGRIATTAWHLIEDQRAALDFLFSFVKEERELTASYICELHQLLCRNQETTDAIDRFGHQFNAPLLKGRWKQLPNNPRRPDGEIHEYCPPEFVQDEIDSLLAMHERHAAEGVRPEISAAWLHHRFTQIHPFQDGNGRVSRALATLVFVKAGYLPLVIRAEGNRDAYIYALEQADNGDLRPLVTLFANIIGKDTQWALEQVRMIRGGDVTPVAASAAAAAKRRLQVTRTDIQELTNRLAKIAFDRLSEVRVTLHQNFVDQGMTLKCEVDQSSDSTESYWNFQIIAAARKYGYFADLAQPRKWVRLRLEIPDLQTGTQHLLVSLHHKGRTPGIMAAIALLTGTRVSEDDPSQSWDTDVLATDEFTYSTPSRGREESFRKPWLEDCVVAGLDLWQSRL